MKRFKVALSFAGEKRGYVSQVASLLAERFGRETVLYDKFHEAEFARANLGMYLPDLYINHSELNVVIFCANYTHKSWCGLEWRALHSLLADRRDEDLMLARFEYAAPPSGIYANTAGFIELGEQSPEAFADLIVQRHGMLNSAASPSDLGEANDRKIVREIRPHDTIEDLRTAMSKAGLHEHVLNMETITPRSLPAMCDIETLGGNPDPIARYMTNERWWAFNGLAIDWRFKDDVRGIALFYMQGLYPCDFQVYARGLRDHVPFPGRAYTPVVSFLGVSAGTRIDRLIVQSGAIGNVRLLAGHLFSENLHTPIPTRPPDHNAELQKIFDKLLDERAQKV